MIKIPWSNANTQQTTVLVQFLLAVGLQLTYVCFFKISAENPFSFFVGFRGFSKY